uniref:NADH-ubiquinone oxidoreductase chain 4 n=1 Tax=Pseudorhabdosynochus yangjiangensis TaxID=1131907 RepID=A0A3G0WZD0_9PLAT|nr:NADH dehydrogenase subunit 4 [Pseudorhabdosynochus yangjiangensis]
MNNSFFNSLMSFDYSSLYLSLISLIYLLLFVYFLFNESLVVAACLTISVLSSLFCFFTNNIVIFWLFYELSILTLLYLILFWSPYSDRYNAAWYLIGYIGATSLPMLLLFYIFYFYNGHYFINESHLLNSYFSILLGILFLTKIPFPPFHSWLPIVHAEASTLVSMALSGYIMKLGLIGVYRFCYCNNFYIFYLYFLITFFICLIFFGSSIKELDYKRWLAYLSLAHIQIVGVGLTVVNENNYDTIFLYSLGHGLSAILLFYLFNILSEGSGSRNWLLLQNINNNSGVSLFILSLSLLTAASFPVTMQFLVEVNILSSSIGSFFYCLLFYIFFLLGWYLYLYSLNV